MLTLGPIAFASPWLLLALALLPILWRILRVIPPAPRQIRFPAIRLLYDLKQQERTPAKIPWWLILLRIILATLIILALAHPLLNPNARLPGSGPLVVVVDDGWAAARDWPQRQRTLADLTDRAERDARPVVLVTTAAQTSEATPRATGLLRAGEARVVAQALQPKPWGVDRKAALAVIERVSITGAAHAIWLSDGIDSPDASALAERLQRFGSLTVITDEAAALPRILMMPETRGNDLVAAAERIGAAGEERRWLRALGTDGRLIAREPLVFADGANRAEAKLVLPTELRNDIGRLDIEDESTAGAVVLLDERWRRRPVGIVSTTGFDASQPLLDPHHYLDRALAPFSEVRRGSASDLLKRELAVMVLPDVGPLAPHDRDALEAWLRAGGMVLRFAGPVLAGGGGDLVPVRLRRGDRALGGALSWAKPLPLAYFDPGSPFQGLNVPTDVVIGRQVLAEPALDLGEKTWARLVDGTPIVTAERRGAGWLILVHTTSNAEWSNLALSGLFVEMLQRMVGLSRGIAGAAGDAALPPIETLDAFGRQGAPPSSALALPRGGIDAQVGPQAPPGFYGSDLARVALNLSPSFKGLAALANLPTGVLRGAYATAREVDLRPWFMTAAILLGLADVLISLALRGLLPVGQAATAALAALALLGAADPARAQSLNPTPRDQVQRAPVTGADAFAMSAALHNKLAYVRTGNAQLDEISRAGLQGLSGILVRRTSIEQIEPMAIDIEADELAFFPLIYWPVDREQRLPSAQAIGRLNIYLRNGGTIIF
ncbi:MAG: DUF4159 domain-containing protein, partial [Alphaproteobacteria bacterium]|nr:DUF4159 domain-containing protein [Alphaproteobacteria bacterium]